MIVYKFEDNRGNLYQYNQRQQELLDDIYECFCGKEYATYHNFWYEKIFDNITIKYVMLRMVLNEKNNNS